MRNQDSIRRDRRNFLRNSAAMGAAMVPAALLGSAPASAAGNGASLPPHIQALPNMTSRVVPITDDERKARLARAQQLMGEQNVDAIFVGGGSSLFYFIGMHWGNSERLTGMVLPKSGDPIYVTPVFERGRTLEQVKFGHDVRAWNEHEDPYQRVAEVMADIGATTGRMAIDEAVPYFRAKGIIEALPHVTFVHPNSIIAACREVKSPAELALMKLANENTLAVYEAVWRSIKDGMTQQDVSALVTAAYNHTGLPGGASVNVGKFTASPHGSRLPQKISEGTPIMFDGGCKADGYTSDITRTVVLGQPNDKMRKVFDIVLKAQTAALKAARPGVSHESLDAAARKVITDAGYGPDYDYFGHRLGHGIGLDMHEWDYLVRGNKRLLKTGMTFSDEPGIYIPEEFGVRLEDILHITEDGGALMTPQSPSLDQPFG